VKYVNFTVEQGTCLVLYNYICDKHLVNRSKRPTFKIMNRILLRSVKYIINTNMIFF